MNWNGESLFQSALLGGGSGGSSGGGSDIDAMIDKSITEYSGGVETIGDYAFYTAKALTKVNAPDATIVGQYAFYQCTALGNVNIPKATKINAYTFYGCSSLKKVDATKASGTIGNYAFAGCTSLVAFDAGPDASGFWSNVFKGCSSLNALILRRTQSICELGNANCLSGTPIDNGIGCIYVPSALIDTYKAATNWAAYATQFRALEDYTVDGTATGALDESKIQGGTT